MVNLWSKPHSDSPIGSIDKITYFTDFIGGIVVVDSTGNTLWKKQLENISLSTGSALDSSRNFYLYGFDCIYSFTPDGDERWKVTEQIDSLAVVRDELLYSLNGHGVLRARSCDDGQVLWSYDLNGSGVGNLTVGSDGSIYVALNDSGIYAIREAE